MNEWLQFAIHEFNCTEIEPATKLTVSCGSGTVRYATDGWMDVIVLVVLGCG